VESYSVMMLRIPHYLDNRLADGGGVFILVFTRKSIAGLSFFYLGRKIIPFTLCTQSVHIDSETYLMHCPLQEIVDKRYWGSNLLHGKIQPELDQSR
jgi:hypothetical protein